MAINEVIIIILNCSDIERKEFRGQQLYKGKKGQNFALNKRGKFFSLYTFHCLSNVFLNSFDYSSSNFCMHPRCLVGPCE